MKPIFKSPEIQILQTGTTKNGCGNGSGIGNTCISGTKYA